MFIFAVFVLETVNTTCLDSLGIHIQYRSQKDGNIAWMFERLTASSHFFLTKLLDLSKLWKAQKGKRVFQWVPTT